MRMIDADALLAAYDKAHKGPPGGARKLIEDAPTLHDPLTTDDFGAVLNCAVRYCIGRETYMPGLVTDWIMSHCQGKLNEKTRYVMAHDIDSAKYLGMDCDVRVWRRFREWLTENDTPQRTTTCLKASVNGAGESTASGGRSR